MNKKLTYFYYLGSIIMVVAAFTVNSVTGKILYMIGLAIMIHQVYKAKMHNIVILNLVAILGFAYSIFSQIYTT